MTISIELKEYEQLMKDLFIAYEYDMKKDDKKIHSKIVSLLIQKNFPEKYIIDKITYDIPKYAELVHKEQENKILFEYFRLLREDIQRNVYSDSTQIKYNIESISNKCIKFVIDKKLVLKTDLEKYNSLLNRFNRINIDIPKSILYQLFPIVGAIETGLKEFEYDNWFIIKDLF